MPWQNVVLSDISTQLELVPVGTYTFELAPGAKFDEKGNLRVSATIVNDGEFTGKRVFFSYPDPESISKAGKVNSWSATALKRLTQAIGEDPQEGESLDTYLNRVAGAHFQTNITHTPATEQYPNPSVNVNIFNPKPAA